MPPTLALRLSRRKIGSLGGNSERLCIFCRLSSCGTLGPPSASARHGQRYSSTHPGSRGLHAGNPAKRPPPDTQDSPRPSWPVVQPQFDNSALNAFLKSRKEQEQKASNQGSNSFKVSQEALGKWARPARMQKNDEKPWEPDRQRRERKPSRDPLSKRTLPRDSPQTSIKSDTTDLPEVPTTNSPAPSVAATGTKWENPYANVLKSNKSAADIESDLFAGIVEEPTKPSPSPSPQKSSLDEILSKFAPSKEERIDSSRGNSAAPSNSTGTNTFTTPVQRFRISHQSAQQIQEAAKKAEDRKPLVKTVNDRPVQSFGFMAAVRRQPPPLILDQSPEPMEALIDEAGDVKRTASTEWRSASREKWTYEVEEEKSEEDPLNGLADLIPQVAEGDELALEEEQTQKKRDMNKLKKRAAIARFKTRVGDIGVWVEESQKVEAPLELKIQKELYIPPSISVANFANLLKIPLGTLQKKMELLGLEPEERAFDYLLPEEMASLIALEFGFEPHVDAQAAFDLFPQPMPEDTSSIPLRPPIVTIMGHVDHGKTTLLDTLRKSSVAASEAGGITQHIGAFSVTLTSGQQITFLDTPGHAAFLTMRERGALVTDIVVLVVAGDDGVMPQTIEAIEHAKKADVPIIVAINKCDREDANPQFVKTSLLENGVELEEFGGEVQCVEVSGLTGEGLDHLEAAIVTLAEVLEMRAPKDGLVEGWIIESTVDPGRGTYTTVLVKRGTLKTGDFIVAGNTYAKVRRMTTSTGKSIKQAPPGTPVEVTGWKERPNAGDMVLQAAKESDAKLAIRNRLAKQEVRRDIEALESMNERRFAARKALRTERERRMVAAEVKRSGQSLPGILKSDGEESTQKELRILIKADVSGSAEAVEEAIKDIGTSEVKVVVLDASVGEITESDISTAIATEASILGFNIRALNPNLRPLAASHGIEIFHHTIIYKLIDDVIARLESMLAPKIELSVIGEAEIDQLFEVTAKGKKKFIAGSKVFNGIISIKEKCRIVRNGKIVYSGHLDTLRHFKDDVKEVRKGTECGLSFEDFDDIKVGDTVQSFREIEVKRKLYG